MTADDQAELRAALHALDAAIDRLRPLHLELQRVRETHWLKRLFMAETGQPAPDEAKAAADLFDGAATSIAAAIDQMSPATAEAAAAAAGWGERVWSHNDHLAAVMSEATSFRRLLADDLAAADG